MKKLLTILLTVMIGLFSLSLSAQQMLTVANGTETNSYIPVYGFYTDAYLHSQIIYPASMVLDMESSTISEMRFYMGEIPDELWECTFEVKLGISESASFSSTAFQQGSMTTVYSGPMDPASNGVVTVTFSNPYEYMGGNLIVDVSSVNTGEYSSGSFVGIQQTGGSISGYSYSSVAAATPYARNFIPKTTFLYEALSDCMSPNNLSVTEITNNSAVFSWHPRSEGTCYYTIVPVGVVLEDTVWISAGNDTSVVINDLAGGTQYAAYVRNDCGDETSSILSTLFYTACDVVSDFPYFEGFEDSWITNNVFDQNNPSPLCWSVFNGGGTTSSTSSEPKDYRWKTNTNSDQVYEGNHSAVCYTDYSIYPHNDWLITPMLNIPENMQLSFWAQRANSYTTEPDEISIWISDVDITLTAPEIPASDTLGLDTVALPGFTQIFQTQIPQGPFTLYELPLTEYTGNRYIAFVRRYSPNDGYFLCLDNVSVEEIPTCERPSDQSTDSAGTNFAILSWTSDASEYILYYKLADADSFSIVPNVTLNADSQYVLEELASGHLYEWYVAAVCDDGTVLPAITEMSFETQCTPITTLPYIVDFETNNIGADGDLPACWSKPGSSYYPFINTYGYYSLSGSSCLYSYSSSPVLAVLPELGEDISIGNLQLSFWAFSYYGTECTVEVGAMTDPSDASSFTAIDTLSFSNSDYSELIADLTSYEGEAHHVALRIACGSYDSGWGTYTDELYIDDLTLAIHASCPRPEDVTVVNSTPTTATLTWTSEENSFMVYYKQAGSGEFVAASESPVEDTTYTVEELTPGTIYAFYVAAVCSDETESPSLTVSTITPCVGLTELPYFCDFESDLVGDEDALLPQCWSRGSANSTNPSVNNYGGYQSVHSLYSYYSNTVAMPPIDTEELPFSDMQVSFYAKGNSGTVLKVGVMSDPFNVNSFVQVGNEIVLTNTYTKYDVSLVGYEGEGNMVAFRTPNYYDCYIDNVTLDHLPDCQRPTVTNVIYTNTQATVNWTAGNEDDNAWQIVITSTYAEPSSLTPEDANDTTFTFEDLTPSTYYQVYVRTDCGDIYSDWSNVYSFTTLNVTPASVPYSCDFEEEEENGNWTMVNGYMTNQWYIGSATNNTPEGEFSLYVSADSGATVTYNTNGANTVWAYRDFQFSDATEFTLSFDWRCLGENGYYSPADYMQVFIGTPVNVTAASYATTPSSLVELGTFNSDSTWNTASLTLDGPIYANTVQRIYFRWYNDYSDGSGISAAVDNIVISEVDCARPADLEMTSIGTTTATLTITPAAESDASWEISLNDSTFIVSTPVVELEDLVPSSLYEISVRTICESGDTSVWSLPITFLTECLLISSVPQTWDFETNNIAGSENYPLPACWNRIVNPDAYSQYPFVTSYDGNFGYNSLVFDAYYDDSYAILPAIDPEELNLQELELSFFAKQTGSSTNIHFEFGVMTDPSDASTFTLVESVNVTNSYPADPYVVSFANYTGEGAYIAVRNITSGYSYASLYLDDVTLEVIPDCLTPTGVTVSDIQETSASIAWTENGEATSWVIRYYEPGDADNAVSVPASTNPFTLTNLAPGTFYIVQVMASCSETESSNWATSPSFMTNCAAITEFPYTEGFESNDLGCWSNENVVGSNSWKTSSSYSSVGSYSVFMNYTVNTESHLISPVFDLSNVSNPSISFDHRHLLYTTGNKVDTFAVYYRTSTSSEWVRIEGYNQANSSFETDTLALPNPTATYQIAFWGYGVDGLGIYIDNIQVTGEASQATDPTVATAAADEIGQTTAQLNATITNPDGVEITAKGFKWMPLMGEDYSTVAATTSTDNGFSATLNDLTPNTDYIFHAFIVFNGDTVSGNDLTFTTLPEDVQPCDVPTGLAASNITHNSFTVTWNAVPDASYTLRYRPAQGQWTSVTPSTNSHELTSLSAETTYEVQVQADCGGDNVSAWSESLNVTTLEDGIPTYLLNSIALYPNPAKEYVDIRVDNEVNVNLIEVYDVYGKLVNTVNVVENPTRINVSGLANGMYFVRVSTDNGAVTKTFVKK